MSELRTWLTGLGLVEPPRWHDGRLYFSDWTAHEVIALDLDGKHEVVARVESFPLCTVWQADGRLVIVDSRQGLLTRLEPDGSLVTHADPSSLGRGWNDIVIDGRGNVYVNRIGFDMLGGEAFAPGYVVHVGPDGSAREVADDIAFPNGMAVTQDNSSPNRTATGSRPSTSRRTAACRTAGSGPTPARTTPTASVSTPRAPSGTPTSVTGAASASGRAVRSFRRSPSTGDASPAYSAAGMGRRCSSWRPSGACPRWSHPEPDECSQPRSRYPAPAGRRARRHPGAGRPRRRPVPLHPVRSNSDRLVRWLSSGTRMLRASAQMVMARPAGAAADLIRWSPGGP